MAGKARRSTRKDNTNLFKDGLNWDKYLQICNLPAAPRECFTQSQSETLVNNFQINDKLESQDPRSPTSVCLSTVVSTQGPRILIRLDGGDACNDFWRLVDSGDIYPLGTHESKGMLLQPPLGYTRNMSTWSTFLAKNREKGVKAAKECFLPEPQPPDRNLFELGMKLEAVDRKNPDLICPATIGDIKSDQVFISFDGWRGAMDYWCHYASRDLFPVGWCCDNDHPLSSPGNKGDNPAVEERLKQLADKSKRQTRSGAGNIAEAEKASAKAIPVETPSSTKFESTPYFKSGRGRGRNRTARSLTPSAKVPVITDKPAPVKDELAPSCSNANQVASVTESSADSETCDSSISSQQSSESSSSENEAESAEGASKKDEEMETEDTNDDPLSEIDESVVEVKNSEEASSIPENSEIISAKKKEKHERKMKKRKKIKKKFKRMYQLGEIDAKVYKERKRYASTGDEDHFLVRSKKRKKHKRKHSMSSLYDSPRKRILGFGTQSSTSSTNFTNRSLSLQSPSFLEHTTSPTSLFGFSRDEIVKKATEGWPSRLMGSSNMVVTSDNKLGKFGSSNITDSSCQTSQVASKENKNEKMEVENSQVTTTTQIDEQKSGENESKQPDSTTSENLSKISSQTVSSTTNSIQTPSPNADEAQSPKVTQTTEDDNKQVAESHKPTEAPAGEPPRKRSRNPQRWTVSDVVDYVRHNETALINHIHLFQTHEIDGQALLLLNSSLAVKYMNMKLGPALKLASLVERVKDLVPPPRSPPR